MSLAAGLARLVEQFADDPQVAEIVERTGRGLIQRVEAGRETPEQVGVCALEDIGGPLETGVNLNYDGTWRVGTMRGGRAGQPRVVIVSSRLL